LKLLGILPFLFLSLLAQGQSPKAPPSGGRLLVYVDPGHGGEDTGAKGPKGSLEKDATLVLAAALVRELEDSGLEARLTRNTDTFVPLWERARRANEAGADLFVSLHLNASKARGAKGSEVYFLALGGGDQDAAELAAQENGVPGPPRAARSPEADDVVAGILDDLSQEAYLQDSERLAVAIQGQLNRLGGIKERGVKQAPFVVLRGAAMPAVLVETLFISNPREEVKLQNPAFLHKAAQAITLGIRRYFAGAEGTPRRRPVQEARVLP
jgi:N-acetylmuramoyl-L-alanine amidase